MTGIIQPLGAGLSSDQEWGGLVHLPMPYEHENRLDQILVIGATQPPVIYLGQLCESWLAYLRFILNI